MARIIHDDQGGQSGNHASGESDGKLTVLSAEGQTNIVLPDGDFIAKGDIARDGQDLVLRSSDGHETVIEGYFAALPAPTITSAQGSQLSPEMVQSFAHSDGPATYAANETANDASAIGLVKEVSGDATVTRTDGTSEPVALGMEIHQGDVIETGAAGAVNIVFLDESSFAVSNNARMAIDEYVFDPATQGGETNVSILRGMFVFTSGLIGRDDPDDVQIDTPVGSIGIRGTTIAGTINPDGESQITVVEGAIVIRNNVAEITLADQYETVKLTTVDSQIQLMGQMDADGMKTSYGALQPVAQTFFNTLNVTPAQDAAPEQQNTAPDGAPAAPEQQNTAPDGMPAAPEQEGTIPETDQNLSPTDGAAEGAGETQAAPEGEPSVVEPEAPKTQTDTYNVYEDPASTDFLQNTMLKPADPYSSTTSTDFTGTTVMPVLGTAPAPLAAPLPPKTDANVMPAGDTTGTGHVALPPLKLVLEVKVDDDALQGDVVGRAYTTLGYPGAVMNFVSVPTDVGGNALFALKWVGPGVYEIILTAAGETTIGTMNLNDVIGDIVVNVRIADGRMDTTSIQANLGDYDTVTAAPAPLNLNTLGAGDGYHWANGLTSGTGYSNAFLGDLDRNGSYDFAVANEASAGSTHIYVDGGSFSDYLGGGSGEDVSVAGGGYDFNLDGKLDFASGRPLYDSGSTDRGIVGLHSGNSGTTATAMGTTGGDSLGSSVGITDFNGDGVGDAFFGAEGLGGSLGGVYKFLGSSGFNFSGLTPTSFASGGASFDFYGLSMTGMRDYNGDGYGDLVVGGNGFAKIYYGNQSGNAGAVNAINGLPIDPGTLEMPLWDLGDVNGDGKSDLLIAATGYNADADGDLEGAGWVSFGGAAGAIGMRVYSDPNEMLIGAGSAGDFNGDGFSDMFFATRNGSTVEAYILYGNGTLPAAITLNNTWVSANQDKLFSMTFDLTGHLANPTTDDFSLFASGIGDQNGDGFGDVLFSSPELNNDKGGYFVVYGKPSQGDIGSQSIHVANLTSGDSNAYANSAGDAVVGDAGANILESNGYNMISFSGGAGNDTMNLESGIIRSLDGGSGLDAAHFLTSATGLMNLSKLESIEKFVFGMSGTPQSVNIGLNDIFSLMQSSNDYTNMGYGNRYTLRFDETGDADVETLNIDNLKGTAQVSASEPQVATLTGLTFAGTTSGYNVYTHGDGYQLLIDQNITVNIV